MSMSVATASLIGAGLSLSGGLFSNRTNRKIAEENLAYQREANEKNMALTEQANLRNLAFQQEENEITRQREDNAVQRAAADMTAAGLSKTLAAGNPASAQGLTAPQVDRAQVNALNNQYKYESALQRMNIAQLMQDMSVKDEQLKQSKALNDANIKLINAQAENYNNQNSVFMQNFQNEQLLKFSNIALNNARTEQSNAETRLTKIIGNSKAQEIRSEIDLRVKQIQYYGSQIKLNEKNLEKLSVEISKILSDKFNLDEATRLLTKDIAYRELQITALNQDIGVASKFGYPVGYMPSGTYGSAFSTGVGIGNLLNFTFKGSSDPLHLFTSPSELYLGMGQNVGTYLPPVT